MIPLLLAASTAAPALEDIVVTAQKRTEAAQQVPISIQSFGAARLEAIGARKLQDIEAAAPSLSFGDGSEQGRTGIRGVIDYARSAGYDARVGVYVDGVYYSRSWMTNQALLGVRQVDVLRGPQGTLFGKDSDAGVIAITTAAPGERLGGEVRGEAGNFGRWQVAARLDAPLSERAAGQIAFTHLQSSGYYRNDLLGTRNQGIRTDAGRVALRYRAGALALVLRGDYARDDNSTLHYTYVPSAGTDPFHINSYYNDGAVRSLGGASLTATLGLPGGFELTSISAWRAGRQRLAFNNETGPTPFLTATFDARTEQISQELRVASPKAERWDVVAGLFYFRGRNRDDNALAYGAGLRLLGPAFAPYAGVTTRALATVVTSSIAGFAQASYRPVPLIELFAGSRLTYERKALRDLTTSDPLGALLAPLSQYRDARGDSFFTPKAGINLHPGATLMLFATAARGFKSGGFNVEGTAPAVFAAGIRFRPERVTSYELGFKSEWLDRRARLNVAAFDQRFTDFQVFTFVPVTIGGRSVLVSSLGNAARVSSRGIETELTLAITRRLTIAATHSWTRARYESYPGGGGMAGTAIVDADGAQTPYAPRHKAYLSADYAAPLGRAMLSAHVGYSIQSPENFDPKVVNPTFGSAYAIPGYALADARIGLSLGGWHAALWSKNVFDRAYIKFANRTAVLGTPALVYGEPRAFGLALDRRF